MTTNLWILGRGMGGAGGLQWLITMSLKKLDPDSDSSFMNWKGQTHFEKDR